MAENPTPKIFWKDPNPLNEQRGDFDWGTPDCDPKFYEAMLYLLDPKLFPFHDGTTIPSSVTLNYPNYSVTYSLEPLE